MTHSTNCKVKPLTLHWSFWQQKWLHFPADLCHVERGCFPCCDVDYCAAKLPFPHLMNLVLHLIGCPASILITVQNVNCHRLSDPKMQCIGSNLNWEWETRASFQKWNHLEQCQRLLHYGNCKFCWHFIASSVVLGAWVNVMCNLCCIIPKNIVKSDLCREKASKQTHAADICHKDLFSTVCCMLPSLPYINTSIHC